MSEHPKHVWAVNYEHTRPQEAIYCILEKVHSYYRVKKLLSYTPLSPPYGWSFVQTLSTADLVILSQPVTDEDLVHCYEAHLSEPE